MKRQEIIALAALALTLVFVFIDQAHDTGFQAHHRGWCSANVMAVIERATPRNGFVGYSLDFVHRGGKHDYMYFDRYPVFFSVGMHVLLNTFELSRGTQIYVARQAMNVLYALSLVMAVAFLIELRMAPGLAVAAAALAGSGKLIVSYRDMIHFDQAALLGFMGLLWAIARWYRVRDTRFVLIASAIAVLMGRGYASFAVLGVWWIVEAVRALTAVRNVRVDYKPVLKQLAFGTPARASVLAIALCGSCLGYNILTEARLRDVPVAEVGIVRSAIKRLTFNAEFNQKKAGMLAWGAFSQAQAKRTLANLQPFGWRTRLPRAGAKTLGVVGAVVMIIALFIASRARELRPPLIIASLAGIAWIFPMRGLTAFHDFTTTFMLSLGVVFMAGVVRLVPARAQLIPALLACACLGYSTHRRNDELRAHPLGSIYTEDFRAIEAKLKPGDAIVLEQDRYKLVPGVPYALGFLLANQPIADRGLSRFVVTNKRKRPRMDHGINLTPGNRKVFLFRY